MQTTKRLVDEADALARSAEKELVVVAVQLAVEVSELVGREICVVGWFVVNVLLVALVVRLNTPSRFVHTISSFNPRSRLFSLSVPVLSGLNR